MLVFSLEYSWCCLLEIAKFSHWKCLPNILSPRGCRMLEISLLICWERLLNFPRAGGCRMLKFRTNSRWSLMSIFGQRIYSQRFMPVRFGRTWLFLLVLIPLSLARDLKLLMSASARPPSLCLPSLAFLRTEALRLPIRLVVVALHLFSRWHRHTYDAATLVIPVRLACVDPASNFQILRPSNRSSDFSSASRSRTSDWISRERSGYRFTPCGHRREIHRWWPSSTDCRTSCWSHKSGSRGWYSIYLPTSHGGDGSNTYLRVHWKRCANLQPKAWRHSRIDWIVAGKRCEYICYGARKARQISVSWIWLPHGRITRELGTICNGVRWNTLSQELE